MNTHYPDSVHKYHQKDTKYQTFSRFTTSIKIAILLTVIIALPMILALRIWCKINLHPLVTISFPSLHLSVLKMC